MKKNTKILITVGSLVAAGGILTGILVGRRQRKGEIEAILANLDKGTGQYGDLRDLGINNAAFDRRLWKNNPACVTIDWDNAEKAAKRIFNAIGIWGIDKEDVILTEFQKFKNQCDVSLVADAFAEKYNLELNGFLFRHVNKGENASRLKAIVDALEPASRTYSNSPMIGQGLNRPGGNAGSQL